jgi:predicted nucleotidyltransferase component of viral defense system
MCYIPEMNLSEIRRLVIIAMFSDDALFDQLTLKGGNALNLVYKFGSRTSVDIDLSLEGDFVDIADASERILRALTKRFAEASYTVFDGKLEPRPELKQTPADDRWGGYEVSFKIIEADKYAAYREDLGRARRESLVIGPMNQRVFKVQISKHEHCVGKREVELDRYTIYVYTPEMLAIEKLRAICQQMAEYPKRGYPSARARDFYDIHIILTSTGMKLNSTENLQLIRNIFRVKEVDVELIGIIGQYRDFHRPDWPSVQVSVSGELREFDFYFDFLLEQTKLLKSLWVE